VLRRSGGGQRREQQQGNEGCFLFSLLSPPHRLRGRQWFRARREGLRRHNDLLSNQMHDHRGGNLFTPPAQKIT
jgi:hypothetical protein